MFDIQQLRNSLERQKGQRDQIKQMIRETKEKIKEKKHDLRQHEQAREIIKEIGLKTQQQLQYHISDITSLALEAVFDDPYELVAEFVQRRNKTECDLYFLRNDVRVDPLSASGGGAIDVASFALRIASWSMQRPRSRNVLILDEPFHWVSNDLKPKASELLKQVSEKLNLQLIMITHSELLTQSADRTFIITKKETVSQIEQI